ncbi:MAG: hypothetical protein IPM66_21225 [Acidobacteriota bacterium]|nr:MAG: hypothetical protein IPM66_21225 [Acidobacteriota bacterium]
MAKTRTDKNSGIGITESCPVFEPTAAVVPFSTLEAMRGALMQLLVNEIDESLDRTRRQASEDPPGHPTSEGELEAMARAAVRKARRRA